jgi:uncharacterized membrane protein YccC
MSDLTYKAAPRARFFPRRAIALVLVSVVIVAIAVLFRNPLLSIGAAVSLAGFAFLAHEVIRHSRQAPVAENGALGSANFPRT